MRKTGPYTRQIALSVQFCCWMATVPALGQEMPTARQTSVDSPREDPPREACADPQMLLAYRDQVKLLVAQQSYSLAITTLEKAYALCPQAVFLRNLATCYQRTGQYRSAISFYRRYIAESSEQRFVGEAQTNIRILTALLEQQTAMERERKRPIWRRAGFWGGLGAGVVTLTGIAIAVGFTTSPHSFTATWSH